MYQKLQKQIYNIYDTSDVEKGLMYKHHECIRAVLKHYHFILFPELHSVCYILLKFWKYEFYDQEVHLQEQKKTFYSSASWLHVYNLQWIKYVQAI